MKHKKILIISPQPWGNVHVSKHHYAIELAKLGNQVTFLNPMKLGKYHFRVTENEIDGFSNLKEAFVELPIPVFLRFKLRGLYNIVIDFFSSFIAKRLGGFDLVWCFDPNYFHNLRKMAPQAIYHPVDPVIYPFQLACGKYADVILGVSNEILKPFQGFTTPQHFISHGISTEFEALARQNLMVNHEYHVPSKLKFGYVGNLLRKEIDWDLIFRVIEKHSDIEFNFWGPYAKNQRVNLPGDLSFITCQRIEQLKNFKNVVLHGVVPSSQMPERLNQMDGFLLVYKYIPGQSDRSNSHKILEYFSTGKVLVSFRVKAYENFRDLIVMPADDNDSVIPDLFDSVIQNISRYNGQHYMQMRLGFAIQNTYEENVKKISKLI